MHKTENCCRQFENGCFYSISSWLKQRFGQKIIKLSIDAGFTCPNRDGSKGQGGCVFCSPGGSGELASDIPGQMRLLSEKWPAAAGYLAYFQSHTNTYAPVAVLRRKYEEALSHPGIVGIAVATRPDCLPSDVLDLLAELNRKTLLWVELGLQTVHDDTARRMNRCFTGSDFDQAMSALSARGIRSVVHLILGLPGERREQMIQSVDSVCSRPIFGLKLHLLNVVRGSELARRMPAYQPFSSKEAYIRLVCDLLERIPPHITIHRLTGDVPRPLLLAPPWSCEKRTILNGIERELKQRGTCQGSALQTGKTP